MKRGLLGWLPLVWISTWFAAAVALRLSGGTLPHALSESLRGPELSSAHFLGFDCFGRDLLLTVLQASATSAAFAAGAVLVAFAIALPLGCAIALAPPRANFASLRALDFLLAFPSLLFALAWAAIRGPGWDTLLFALLIGTVPPLIRLVEVSARETLALEYVLAARSLGAGPWRILASHLVPSVLPVCRVKIPNLFAHALIAEATLSFLGIGAPIGRETWGSLLSQGKDYLIEAPHIAIASGLPLVFTLFSLQWISEKWSRSLGSHASRA